MFHYAIPRASSLPTAGHTGLFMLLGLHMQMYMWEVFGNRLLSTCPILLPILHDRFSTAQLLKEPIPVACLQHLSSLTVQIWKVLPWCSLFHYTILFGHVLLVHPSLIWPFHPLTLGIPRDSIFRSLVLFIRTFPLRFIGI